MALSFDRREWSDCEKTWLLSSVYVLPLQLPLPAKKLVKVEVRRCACENKTRHMMADARPGRSRRRFCEHCQESLVQPISSTRCSITTRIGENGALLQPANAPCRKTPPQIPPLNDHFVFLMKKVIMVHVVWCRIYLINKSPVKKVHIYNIYNTYIYIIFFIYIKFVSAATIDLQQCSLAWPHKVIERVIVW